MSTFEIVKKLAEKRKISIAELERNLEFGTNSIYAWKNHTPKVERLEQVANYFNVSVDYLLGREEANEPMTEDDLSVLFRLNTEGLSEDKKEKVKEEMTRFMKFVIEDLKDDD